MANKEEITNIEPTIQYSATHEYLYGNGSKEAYERELNSVKAELRRAVFGNDKKEEPEEKLPRPINGAAVALAIITGIMILAIAIVGVLSVTGTVRFARYDDSVAIIRDFINKLPVLKLSIAETAAFCAILGAFFTLTSFFGAVAVVRSQGIGKGMVLGITVMLVANAALMIAGLHGAIPIIRLVLTVLSLAALLTALFGGRKHDKNERR